MPSAIKIVLPLLQRVDVARAPNGLFASQVLLELRYQVEGTYLVPYVISNRLEESNTV